jgi:hypothetical protein
MAYLDDPIPRKVALAVVIGQAAGQFLSYRAAVKRIVAEGNAIMADQEQRIAILNETCHFLLDRADDATAAELNEKMDYWRVVRGIDPREG